MNRTTGQKLPEIVEEIYADPYLPYLTFLLFFPEFLRRVGLR